jgi:hypothetical protein
VADPHDDDTSPWPPRPPAEPPTAPAVPPPDVLTTDPPAAPEPPPAAGSAPPPDAPAASPATTAWIPPGAARSTAPRRTGGWDGARVAGIILVLVGVFLLLRRFVPLDSQLLLPIVAIVIGGALVLGALRPRGRNG